MQQKEYNLNPDRVFQAWLFGGRTLTINKEAKEAIVTE